MLKFDHASGYDDCIRWYSSDDGRLTVQVDTCESCHGSGSLMEEWVKRGWVPRWMDEYLSVQVYFRDDEGVGHNWHNPQIKHGTCREIEFGWLLEATPRNEEKLLQEIERRYENDMRI